MPTYRIQNGDCRNELKSLAGCSVDSVVTDPPYELGFMGKGWDKSGIAYNVEVWRECLRVLKPGGHLLAFGGSRTYHRLACATEDAGFEIRDQIQWIYGSGFPKSLDVSKAIDARGGQDTSWFMDYVLAAAEAKGITRGELTNLFPSRNGNATGWLYNKASRVQAVTPEQFNTLRDFLNLPFVDLAEAEREIVGRHDGDMGGLGGKRLGLTGGAITAPATDAAKQWNGWGTALKPAHEPIVLARKSLIGTVAENVLRHGTGGLNVDGCRVEGNMDSAHFGGIQAVGSEKFGQIKGNGYRTEQHVDGRWPANVIHDGSDEVLAEFDKAGERVAGRFPQNSGGIGTASGIYGKGNGRDQEERELDSGSAARFFYCAKASKEDREDGLDDLPIRSAGDVTDRKDGSDGLNSPRAGAGRTNGSRNHHPTVKPTDLMRYLCRLVTPPNGIVLDPFCGSGSTGKAAILEGLNFIGIDKDAEYCELSERRIAAVTRQGLLFGGSVVGCP